ncbi:hypothetical protein ABPG72_008466 [Tetrahymena utriculariae]
MNQDKIQYQPSKHMQLSIFKSQNQNQINVQESDRVLNTDKRLLIQDDNYFQQFQNKQIEIDKDNSQIIGQEIINYNSIRAHSKLVQPGKQLQFLQQISQIEVQEMFSIKTEKDQNK